jgi:hypothetical protein
VPVPAPPIITCPQWGARPPARKPTLTGRPVRSIFHHTAGHARAWSAESPYDRQHAIDYALELQADMMDRRGWADSGHNFLVMRSGLIVQGRWGSVTAIEHGRMVVSAHCPGQNDQPGIEHEQVDGEPLTPLQETASVWLHAWIFDRCRIRPTEIYPHGHFYATACPGSLTGSLLVFRLKVAGKLTAGGRPHRGTMSPLARARFAGVGSIVV